MKKHRPNPKNAADSASVTGESGVNTDGITFTKQVEHLVQVSKIVSSSNRFLTVELPRRQAMPHPNGPQILSTKNTLHPNHPQAVKTELRA